jgi:hypothetical protein
MKKTVIILLMGLFIAAGANAGDSIFGAGVFGGLNIPILQQDQANGSAFGVKGRLKFIPFVVVEPNITFGKWGKPDAIEGIDLGIDGSKITSYGIDLTLGDSPGKAGFKFFGLLGAGIYKVENEDTGYDESKLGFSAGLGFMIGVGPSFDIDIRGKLIVAPQEESAKKAALVMAGINYYFGLGM